MFLFPRDKKLVSEGEIRHSQTDLRECATAYVEYLHATIRPGDIIEVASGIYEENLVIRKPVELRGAIYL